MGYWMIVLDEKNILLGLEAEDRNDCIRKIAAVMEKKQSEALKALGINR